MIGFVSINTATLLIYITLEGMPIKFCISVIYNNNCHVVYLFDIHPIHYNI